MTDDLNNETATRTAVMVTLFADIYTVLIEKGVLTQGDA